MDEQFQSERTSAALPRARWVLALILLVMLLPLVELPKMREDRTPEALSAFLWLRFAVLAPLIALMFGLTFWRAIRPWLSQICAVGLVLACTVLAISVQVLNPVVISPFGRLTGSALPLMIAGVVLLPLSLRDAVFTVTAGSAGVFAAMWFLSRPMPDPLLMLSAALTLVALSTAIMIAVAHREQAAREMFMQRERLAALNTELRETNARLAAISGQKSDFLAMAAHELRSPLLVAGLTAEQLQAKVDPTPQELSESLGLLGDVLTRMNDVLASFLQSQAALDRSVAHVDQPVRLDEAAGAAIRRAEPITSRKGQSVRFAPADEAVLVRADPGLLGQVLDNLLSNASKFSPAGSVIGVVVAAQPAGGRGSISVQDAGPGLTESDRTRLFQKYSRLSARPTGGESSTGLGLSIVKLLMDAMKGEVECASEPGRGAIFRIRLPLA